MEFWIIFWTVLLAAALAIFAGLAIVVSIGGFCDVRALLRSIERRHSMAEEQAAEGEGASSQDARAGPDTPR